MAIEVSRRGRRVTCTPQQPCSAHVILRPAEPDSRPPYLTKKKRYVCENNTAWRGVPGWGRATRTDRGAAPFCLRVTYHGDGNSIDRAGFHAVQAENTGSLSNYY